MLQDDEFAELKEGNILGNFDDFKPKKSPFRPFLIVNWSKIHKIGDFGYKKNIKI